MAPVAEKMLEEAGLSDATAPVFTEMRADTLFKALDKGKEPLRTFLERNAHEADRRLFLGLAQRLAQKNGKDPNAITVRDFRVVVPAFVTSQLTEAFQIGFLLFIPFLVIDMLVSNILQAMGMFMLSPTMISLPFKLLLFVLVKGWVTLIQNLVLSYA
jgi:Flagellar biosynthesis pathway, component FliP